VEVLLLVVVAHRRLAVHSPRHRQTAGVWTLSDLNAMVQPTSSIVWAETVVDVQKFRLRPGLRFVCAVRQASLTLAQLR
jgi:hypothetical protein